MKRHAIIGLTLALLTSLTGSAHADAHEETEVSEQPAPTPFDRGRWTVSFGLGSQNGFDQTYYIASGGLGHYVAPGLEVGSQAAYWFGDSPSVFLVEPYTRYVLHRVSFAAKPYVGAFYRHWFVSDEFDDVDSLGGRLGVLWLTSGVIIGIGARYEHLLGDCVEDCDTIRPEIGLALTF